MSVVPTPEWLSESKDKFSSMGDIQLADRPPMDEFEYDSFTANVLHKGDDLIYNVYVNEKYDLSREVLAKAIEAHFGSTDTFSADFEEPANLWSFICRGCKTHPLFDEDRYTESFLDYLHSLFEKA